MKKLLVSLFLLIHFAAYAQVVGTPYIIGSFSDPSSNGTAVVSAYTCTTASAGAMTSGISVSGVTQTITATVTTVGTYAISTTANGVTFAASGTFAGTGAQNIVLTATGTPTAAGNNSFTLDTTPNCSFSRTTVAPLPANITLATITPYFVLSVNDQDYLPYTGPTVAASLATAQAANGVNEATALNIQGSLTTTGETIKIPYTVVTATVSLPAFSQTINIPASFTEDNVARDVTFSYPDAMLAVGSGTISATLQAVGGTLNAKN
jgi:LysM repeat protein